MMILTCSKCLTQYMVASSAIGSQGRKVKCKNCSHVWFQDAVMEDPRDAPEAPFIKPGTAVAAGLPALRDDRQAPIWLKIAAIASLVFAFIALLAALYHPLSSIGLAKAYRIFGLYDTTAIACKRLEFKIKPLAESKISIAIKGKLVNETDKDRLMPRMAITILDYKKRQMSTLLYPLPLDPLEAEDEITFDPRIGNVPDHAEWVVIDVGNAMEIAWR